MAANNSRGRKLPTLWGYSVTRICYRLGELGWKSKDAKLAVDTLLLFNVPKLTIGQGITDGKNAKYGKGKGAPLTEQQLNELILAAGSLPAVARKSARVPLSYPDEVAESDSIYEGALKRVTVNAYERDPKARLRCIAAHKPICSVCGFKFSEKYGEVADGFIHVHHLRPLSEIGKEHVIDPVADLRPVCPNCHAVLHLRIPAYSIEEVKAFISSTTG